MFVHLEPVRYLTAEEARRAKKYSWLHWVIMVVLFASIVLVIVSMANAGFNYYYPFEGFKFWEKIISDIIGFSIFFLAILAIFARGDIAAGDPVYLIRGRYGQGDTGRTIDGAGVEFIDHVWLYHLEFNDIVTAEVLMTSSLAGIIVVNVTDIQREIE